MFVVKKKGFFSIANVNLIDLHKAFEINLRYSYFFWQKAGDEHQLYNRKLRETPKACSTATLAEA